MQIVIFGATGDLATSKLFPALHELHEARVLQSVSSIIGFSRRGWSDAEFRSYLTTKNSSFSNSFLEHITYARGTFTDPQSFSNLAARITEPTLFYFAVGFNDFISIAENLANALSGSEHVSKHRLLFEKPFGASGEHALKLWETLTSLFSAEQLYLVDHYLAKKTVRALAPIDPVGLTSVRMSLIESNTAEGRGAFYDATGALRDVGQNHVLSTLARAVLPNDPTAFIRSLEYVESTRGQYEGYKEHVNNPTSDTETYFNVTATSSMETFKNVQFIFEGGKGFAEKSAEVTISTKGTTHHVQRIQPHSTIDTSTVTGFDGYAELFKRALDGDSALFLSIEEVLATWKLIDAVRNDWQSRGVPLVSYALGAYNQSHD